MFVGTGLLWAVASLLDIVAVEDRVGGTAVAAAASEGMLNRMVAVCWNMHAHCNAILGIVATDVVGIEVETEVVIAADRGSVYRGLAIHERPASLDSILVQPSLSCARRQRVGYVDVISGRSDYVVNAVGICFFPGFLVVVLS